MKQKILILFFILGMSFVACQRTSREYGAAKKEVAGAPAYTPAAAVAQVAAVPAVAHVESVMPKGALDGQSLYTKNCGVCHQATGLGLPAAFPPLDNSKYVNSDNVGRMAAIMVYGLQGPINVNGTTYTSVMAPLGGLKDEELAAISTYVRSAWSNKAGAVEPAVFAEVRKKHGDRSLFAISELGEEQ